MKCMKKALFNCLHFHDFPPERWKFIRTNDILERAFRDVHWYLRPNGSSTLAKHLFYILNSLGKSFLGHKSLYINKYILLTVTQGVCY